MSKADVLKVLRRHQLLSLAVPRQITPTEAAREPGISLSHAKKLLKRLKQTGRNPDWPLLPPASTRAKRAASGIQKARW